MQRAARQWAARQKAETAVLEATAEIAAVWKEA